MTTEIWALFSQSIDDIDQEDQLEGLYCSVSAVFASAAIHLHGQKVRATSNGMGEPLEWRVTGKRKDLWGLYAQAYELDIEGSPDLVGKSNLFAALGWDENDERTASAALERVADLAQLAALNNK